MSGLACAIETQNASIVCPESVRPLRSTIVPESQVGTRTRFSANTSSMAKIAALRFAVSKLVSASRRSTPPSKRARTCSA